MTDAGSIDTGNIHGIGSAMTNGAQSHVHYHERRHAPAPRQAPALPAYFVPGPNDLEPFRSALCGTEHIVVAFTGLEGVGKTTLASAVAKDTDKYFADGVL